jgi:hypothetical protein
MSSEINRADLLNRCLGQEWTGTVLDASGAVVPGATVTLINTATEEK